MCIKIHYLYTTATPTRRRCGPTRAVCTSRAGRGCCWTSARWEFHKSPYVLSPPGARSGLITSNMKRGIFFSKNSYSMVYLIRTLYIRTLLRKTLQSTCTGRWSAKVTLCMYVNPHTWCRYINPLYGTHVVNPIPSMYMLCTPHLPYTPIYPSTSIMYVYLTTPYPMHTANIVGLL
jgi:hypothetical protein